MRPRRTQDARPSAARDRDTPPAHPGTAVARRQALTAGLALGLALALAAAGRPARAQVVDDPREALPATPRYLLQAPNGRTVMPEDFRGRFQLIAFGYTGCPDVCPTTMLEMQQVLAGLGERARHLQPIFVSVDPERDTLPVLGAYAEAFDRRILALTGPHALLQRAAEAFKVRYEKVREPGAAPDVYTIDHTVGMVLLGPDGRWIARIGYSTPVADLVARLQGWMGEAGL